MHLLWFNLATDLDDAALGFTTSWIRAVAEKVDRISVITMRAGRVELPDNVTLYSVGKEIGYTIPRRVVRFYRLLTQVLRSDPPDVCFSHMMPAFTVLSAPLLKPMRIPIVTWHAHPGVTMTLRAAHHFSDRMVTSLPGAYRYRKDKLVVIGQGIDVTRFAPDARKLDDPPMILCAGRLSPVKDHPTLLRAMALLHEHREAFQVVILGNPARPSDRDYLQSLESLVRELRIGKFVRFHPAVAVEEVPEWYRHATVHVNLTAAGFGDKVALEAMACGVPSLVANRDLGETLGERGELLLFRAGDSIDLERRVRALLALPPELQRRLGEYLRGQVIAFHSLTRLAEGLRGLFEELRRGTVGVSSAPNSSSRE